MKKTQKYAVLKITEKKEADSSCIEVTYLLFNSVGSVTKSGICQFLKTHFKV
jgi:hypothetical protein